MKSVIINKTKNRIPHKFIQTWNNAIVDALKQYKVVLPKAVREITIVIVNPQEMTVLNSEYRGKKYATDVLSFVSHESLCLGELVICFEVIKKQSQEHDLTINEELGYMLLHGILHLLGFDHEKTKKEAQQMFKLQDDVFGDLCQSSKHVHSSRVPRRKKKIASRARTM